MRATKALTASFLVLALLAATGSAAATDSTMNLLDIPGQTSFETESSNTSFNVSYTDAGFLRTLNGTSGGVWVSKPIKNDGLDNLTVNVYDPSRHSGSDGGEDDAHSQPGGVMMSVISGPVEPSYFDQAPSNRDKQLLRQYATDGVTTFNLSDIDDQEIVISAGPDDATLNSLTLKGQELSDTNNTTDGNTTEWDIIALRNAPVDQSFDYLNSWDSSNITIENQTVTADSDNAVYLTKKVRADKFDRIELDTSGSATVKVLDAQDENQTVLKQKTVSGMSTVNFSDINTTGIKLRIEMDNGTKISYLKIYGDMYSGGLFGGGGNLITGNFFGSIGSLIGKFALADFVAHIVGSIFGVIPFL